MRVRVGIFRLSIVLLLGWAVVLPAPVDLVGLYQERCLPILRALVDDMEPTVDFTKVARAVSALRGAGWPNHGELVQGLSSAELLLTLLQGAREQRWMPRQLATNYLLLHRRTDTPVTLDPTQVYVRYQAEVVERAFREVERNAWEPRTEMLEFLGSEELHALAEKVSLALGGPDTPAAQQYRARQQAASNRFITNRDYTSYAQHLKDLGPAFLEHLARLGPDSHWIDFGCGEGAALRSYFARRDPANRAAWDKLPEPIRRMAEAAIRAKARVTGITVSSEPGKPYDKQGNPFALRSGLKAGRAGKRLRIIRENLEKIEDETLGKADLITDIWGAFSYTNDPMAVLQRYIDRLNVGGAAYIYTDSVAMHGEYGKLIGSWLVRQSIPGLTVELGQSHGGAFRIIKTAEGARLPPTGVVSMSLYGTPARKEIQPVSSGQ